MEKNYYGAIRTIQAVLPSMREAKSGLIINTSSLVGQIFPPFFGTYSATKQALEAYSKALRYEVTPFGVDVAIVEPGPFETGLLTGWSWSRSYSCFGQLWRHGGSSYCNGCLLC